jgi:polyisoprenoid-binding protein YceI
MKRAFVSAVLLGILSVSAQAASYTIDPYHSSVSFSIKHVIGKVVGQFSKFSGTFDYDAAKPAAWSAMATIDAASINTGIEKRDNHLRTAEFFDTTKYPNITFKSTGVTDVKGSMGKLHGDLTMHGVTKPVVLDLEVAGTVKDPMGKGERAGATAKGRVSRSDFGIGPTAGPMAGMIGTDVEITIEIEGVSK